MPAISIVDQALSLPVNERINMVESLLQSLNQPLLDEIDQKWAAEAEHRIQEIECGNVQLIPGQEVFDKIRRKYAK